jgi:glycosyltransferase involved in cell wall biosynthesis
MALFEINWEGQAIPVPAYPPDAVRFTFFVPCYNEEKNVVNVINKIVEATALVKTSYEILVFDDCSRDRTADLVKAYRIEHPDIPLRLFGNTVNRGVARNFIEGAFQGQGQYYRIVMGDDVESVETLTRILGKAGEADIVIPYYTVVAGKPLNRRIISRLYTELVNLASNRRLKYYNGSPLFVRREVLRFHVEATGLGFQAEFLLRLLQEGRTFVEFAVPGSDREGSTSLNFRNFVSVGYSIFKIFARRLSGQRPYISR